MNVPKQLIRYNDNETVVERIVRLCQHHVKTTNVFTDDTRIENVIKDKATILPVERHEFPAPVDKVMCSQKLWSTVGPTVILFGDVFFTEEAIEIILGKDVENLTFFGRLHASKITGKNGGEIYGLKFNPNDHNLLRAHCEFIRWSVHTGHLQDPRMGLMKTVLASLVSGEQDNPYKWDIAKQEASKYFKLIDDWTEDFDVPRDFLKWRKLRLLKTLPATRK